MKSLERQFDPPVVIEHKRYVDDPPRVIERHTSLTMPRRSRTARRQ
jgi:hypothetical protein